MKFRNMMKQTLAITGVTMLAAPAFSQSSTVEGFDGGTDGGFIGNASFEATGGNPDGNAYHLVTAFFTSLRTGGIGEPVNPSFLGDYSSFDEVTFGFDVKVASITDFIGNEIARPIGIQLIDRDIQGPSGPSGIFYTLGYLSESGQPDWTEMSVTIDDTTSATLPAGWIGFGDEDPMTFEPILPPGATFATVLAGVDEFRISGAVPGFFFNNANYDVRIDNVTLDLPPTPTPSSTVEGFDGGTDGGFIGNASFEATGGNPGGNAYHLVTAFFTSLRTGGIGEPVNPNFLGDYSSFEEATFGFDVKVASITDFIGNEIARPIGIQLIDRDIQGPSGPSGIFYTLGYLSESGQPDWTELSVTIDDTTSATLPAGWIGFGDEDPMTFEPILPPGATFATVLAGVDEFRISGAVPGFFFNNANYDVRIDNVTLDLPGGTIGKSYCGPGVPNSTGNPGVLTAAGSTVAADEDVTLTASDLPPGNVCLFIASVNQGFIQPPRSCGPICLMGPDIARFKFDASTVDDNGNCSLAIDPFIVLTNPPQPIMAGQSWNFQAWHRDAGAGPDCNNNFTDAVEITFE